MMTSTTMMIRKLVSKALLENNLNALLKTKVPHALINMDIACYRLIPLTYRQSEKQYIKPTNKGNV